MKAIRFLDALVYSLIDVRRGGGEDRGDLLSMLVHARDGETGKGIGRKQLRDKVITFLAAGYETTARSLGWVFYLLDQNPEEGRKLREELARVLSGRVLTYEDLLRLVYTKMFVQEAMRVYPPVWGLVRRAKGEDEIRGYRILRGSRVIISPYVTHRHSAFWEHPEKFDPERFIPERSEGRPTTPTSRSVAGRGSASASTPLSWRPPSPPRWFPNASTSLWPPATRSNLRPTSPSSLATGCRWSR